MRIARSLLPSLLAFCAWTASPAFAQTPYPGPSVSAPTTIAACAGAQALSGAAKKAWPGFSKAVQQDPLLLAARAAVGAPIGCAVKQADVLLDITLRFAQGWTLERSNPFTDVEGGTIETLLCGSGLDEAPARAAVNQWGKDWCAVQWDEDGDPSCSADGAQASIDVERNAAHKVTSIKFMTAVE